MSISAVIVPALQSLAAPIDNLQPDPSNARRGDVAAIKRSLNVFGQRKPVVVKRTGSDAAGNPSGIIIAGNHTYAAACELGWSHVAAVFVDDDASTAKAYALADNRTGELATWDEEQLAATLRELSGDAFDMSALGWTNDDLAALLVDADAPAAADIDAEDDDTTPPAVVVTRFGDVWLLGPHRVACGDCRDHETVSALLGGARINVAFTSPPYAEQRTYDPSSGFQPIPPDEYADWFEDVQANVRAHLADDGSWFVNIKEHCHDGQRVLYVKDLTIAHVRRWGWRFVDEFAWTRGGVPGTWSNRFKNGWEPVFHFSTDGSIKFNPLAVGHESDDVFHEGGRVSGTNRTGNVGWHGGDVAIVAGTALPSNVVEIHPNPATMKGADHSAAFPVKLPAWFIRAYSDPGDVVYDPFMGSGSTLLAAHQEERVAYGCEISAGYVDVICRRFQRHTGILPVLAATGQAHDFAAGEGGAQRETGKVAASHGA